MVVTAVLRRVYKLTPVTRTPDDSGGFTESLGTPVYVRGVIAPAIRLDRGQVRQYPYVAAFDTTEAEPKVGDRIEYEGRTLVIAELAAGADNTVVGYLTWYDAGT